MATYRNIPVAPADDPRPPTGGGGGGGSSSGGSGPRPPSGGSGGSGGGGGGGGRGGGFDPYKDSIRRENEAKRKASQKYLEQAKTLELQAKALKHALGQKGFAQALNTKLRNVNLVQQQQDKALMEGYGQRVGSLKGAASDNEKDAADQSVAALTNRGRERANALSEVAAQGAGESDALRAQSMSLRNWEANQSEVNRGFFDTLRSVNSSLTDLNVDTKSGRINIATQANADREQLWNNYYDQRMEAYTQLGNIRGQQAELYGMANEAVSSNKVKQQQRRYSNQSGAHFMAAATTSGQAWTNPGAGAALMNWKGEGAIAGNQSSSNLAAVTTDTGEPKKRPEGASLRKWD